MSILATSQKRCSIRKYSDKAIEPDKLAYVLECGKLAPSAVNYQPWYFVVIQSEEGIQKIRECYPREWFKTASTYLLICGDHSQSWKRASDGKDHMDIDVSIAAEHICLAAAEQDLGTCWVCNFDTELCRTHFNIPNSVEPVVILSIGYPETDSLFELTPKKRKPISEVIIKESF